MSAAADTLQGPGALLGAARRRQGLHIAALAAQLKVSPARLEALEAERWDELPDPTHARALATSVCRVLGIEAGPVLAGMPRGAGAALERVSAGLNQPVREATALGAASVRWGLGAAVLLLAGALAVKFWPATDDPVALSGAVELPVEASEPLPVGGAAPAAEPASQPAAPSVAPAASSVNAPAAPLPVTPALATPAPAPTVAPAQPTVASGAGLELRATQGASWVSIVDAAGNSLASRLLNQGESLSLPATGAPLRVVLGNAPAMSLSWRGQPQPLVGYEQRRVAKLELK